MAEKSTLGDQNKERFLSQWLEKKKIILEGTVFFFLRDVHKICVDKYFYFLVRLEMIEIFPWIAQFCISAVTTPPVKVVMKWHFIKIGLHS